VNRRRLLFPAFCLLAVAAFVALVSLTFEYDPESSSGAEIWIPIAQEVGAANAVSSIYLGTRLLDTLLEVLVFTVAVLGVRYFLELPARESVTTEEIPESHVVGLSAYILLPWILLVGIYVTVYGHISSGGGFSGGVIAATALLFVAVAVGPETLERRLNESRNERIEWAFLVALLLFALGPVAFGAAPLSNLLPRGTPGTLFSGGSLLPYNVMIGIKVFVGSWAIVHHFVRHRGTI
jgi:multicomponent Na+:H+ antiporter subunit B